MKTEADLQKAVGEIYSVTDDDRIFITTRIVTANIGKSKLLIYTLLGFCISDGNNKEFAVASCREGRMEWSYIEVFNFLRKATDAELAWYTLKRIEMTSRRQTCE